MGFLSSEQNEKLPQSGRSVQRSPMAKPRRSYLVTLSHSQTTIFTEREVRPQPRHCN